MFLIDRVLLKMFWSFFLGTLTVFVTLFIAIEAMSMLVNYSGISPGTIFRYYMFGLPDVVGKMLPVACLSGLMLTMSTLNKNNELVALFASGLSLFRIALPQLLSVIFISVLGFFSTDRLAPIMNRSKNYVYYYEIEKKPSLFSTVKTNRIWYKSKNSIFNIKTLSEQGDVAEGLTIYFFADNWDLLQMMNAKRVEFAGKNWKLFDGAVTVFTSDSSFPLTSKFKSKTIAMSEDTQDLQGSGQASTQMTVSELSRFISKNKEAGLDTVRYEVEYHNKFSFALISLVMCLLGLPFTVGKARGGGNMKSLGIALVLVFSFWVLSTSTYTLGIHGTLRPIMAAWLPHALMGGAALVLLRRIKR